jgi:TonB family protein
LILKQVDTIDELVAATPAGEPAIVLWDARDHSDPAAVLSRLQLHSTRFAIVALDHASSADAWTIPMQHRHVVALVALPLAADSLTAALDGAREEVNARMALLGEHNDAAPSVPSGPRKTPWTTVSIIAGVLIAGAGVFVLFRHSEPPVVSPTAAGTRPAPHNSSKSTVAADDKVDALIDKAQQAMLDRHYIDPTEGSALSLYRSALLIDPNNGEASQGLQRLSEVLIARVQSALDERKFDVSLQALETARSIDPKDRRLAALDERIASLRAELGPAQIQAALNAQNFDRAVQLIEEAARAKSVNGAKLAQLRDEVRLRREDFDAARFLKLVDARLQQDRLLEPRNDSAAYYLNQARSAGASAGALQGQTQELLKRLAQDAHDAIEQRRFGDAEQLLAGLRDNGAPSTAMANLQRDLGAAHNQQAQAPPERPKFLELAQSRLAQGNVIEPENDSALFYVNQLRSADPKNGGLPQISAAVQAKIFDLARAALDASRAAKAEGLLQLANGLGTSADSAALNERLLQLKQAATAMPEVSEGALTRVKGIELEYPVDALRQSIEGWVDISFVVTPHGSVSTIKVLDSSPQGVFESAASKAVSRLRYKPMIQGGKAIAVGTRLRISFRMTK